VESVAETVGPDLPIAGEIRLDRAVLSYASQTTEYERAEVLIRRILATEQRIEHMRLTSDTLHIRPSVAGPEHGGVVDGQVGEQQHDQHDTEQYEKNLPADTSCHVLSLPHLEQN
jgi:hypothetical protein